MLLRLFPLILQTHSLNVISSVALGKSFSLFVNPLLCLINADNPDLHHVPDLHDLARVPDEPVRHPGDVHQSVLMDADVHERAEIDHIPYRPRQLHPGLQVLHIQHIGPQHRLRQILTGISSRLLQLAKDVLQRGQANSGFLRQLFEAVCLRPDHGVRGTVPQKIRTSNDQPVTLMFRPAAVYRNSAAVAECGGREIARKKAMVYTPGEMAVLTLKPEDLRNLPSAEITVRIERS